MPLVSDGKLANLHCSTGWPGNLVPTAGEAEGELLDLPIPHTPSHTSLA